MDKRPPVLQGFLDQLFDALKGGPALPVADRCIDRVFTALGDYRGPGHNVPGRLPACSHLTPALDKAGRTHAALALSFAALEPQLTWTRRPKWDDTASANFVDSHANALIVGPNAIEERDDVWVGVSLLAPHVRYPDHNHAPEEVYLLLSEGRFQHGEDHWFEPGIGGKFYNTPNIRHAMASGDEPFLAIWCLPVS